MLIDNLPANLRARSRHMFMMIDRTIRARSAQVERGCTQAQRKVKYKIDADSTLHLA